MSASNLRGDETGKPEDVYGFLVFHSPASQDIQCAAAVIMSVLYSAFTACCSIVISQIKVNHT